VYTSTSVEPVRALAFDPVRDLLYSMQGPTMVGFFVRDGVEHRAVIRDERYRSAFAFAWVGHVPPSQQNSQGALIKNFLLRHGIEPGTEYRVVVN
jgi:hypothetical protein